MNKISKRKDGRLQIKKQINGFKIDVIAKTKQDLILKYRAQISAYKKATKNIITLELPKKSPKLKDWLTEYYEKYKKPFLKDETAKTLKHYFDVISDSMLGNVELNKINASKVQEYLNTLTYSRTKELIALYLRASLKKYFKHDIFEDVVLEAKYNVVRKPFSYEEQKIIWKNLDNFKYKNLVKFYLFTGIRKNELPLDMESSLINQDHLIKIICEKKRDKKEVYRYIDLSEKAFNFIKANINDFKINPNTVADNFTEFLKGLNIKGTLHTLRHTFTSNYYTLGINLKLLSSWLGHAKTETTIEHYVAIDRTINKQKIEELYGDWLFKLE